MVCRTEEEDLKHISQKILREVSWTMNDMKITFKNPNEILEFVNTVSKYEFDMDIKRGRVIVDAKSLLGIMHLGLNSEMELLMHSDDCEELQKKIAKYAA